MTEVYLIRHGEAEGNVFRRIHGQYDGLLTPRGFQQMEFVRKRFESIHVDACYASDLARASLTAQAIAVPKGLPLHRDKRFREVNVGVWEDLPFGWLDRNEAEQMRRFNHDPSTWVTIGAERYQDYVGRFLEAMEEAIRAHEGGTIAIFAHGCVIRGVLMHLFFHDSTEGLPYSDNTGVSKLLYDGKSFAYEFLNDNSHLPEEYSTYAIQRWWRATDNRKAVNLWYEPYRAGDPLPAGLAAPELDANGRALKAVLNGEVVGLVSMSAPEDGRGRILGMGLLEGMDGRYYGDQLLGAAVSHFRHLGITQITAAPGWYPDDLIDRFAFDPVTRTRSFDTREFLRNAGM